MLWLQRERSGKVSTPPTCRVPLVDGASRRASDPWMGAHGAWVPTKGRVVAASSKAALGAELGSIAAGALVVAEGDSIEGDPVRCMVNTAAHVNCRAGSREGGV